jgi:TfoX/Sxy family transcriptional regulator of competence genes
MFGYPAVFVNGNLFAGLHQENFILRLSEAHRTALCSQHGAQLFEPMPGRRMRE